MFQPNRLLILPVATLAAFAPAHAMVYLTVPQAQKLMFGEEALTPLPIVLTKAQTAAIEKASGVKVASPILRVWRAANGYFFADAVIGKHELINYAVGINQEGEVRHIEILEYREAHGGEIRNAAWRAQFDGKHYGDAVRLGEDIQGISGATLSCEHVTDGIRRLLATYAIAIRSR